MAYMSDCQHTCFTSGFCTNLTSDSLLDSSRLRLLDTLADDFFDPVSKLGRARESRDLKKKTDIFVAPIPTNHPQKGLVYLSGSQDINHSVVTPQVNSQWTMRIPN